MSQETYFESYMEIISQGIKSLKKISFKRINVVNDLITKFEGFLAKEVYGRIKPTNYLLLFLIALGGRNSKMYAPIILTIQKLFSNNYIAADEELSGAMQFIKQQHKQFFLLPIGDYSRKTFQQIYLQTLVSLPDKTQLLNILICKNMSLIFRLSQSNLPASLITTICDFFVDALLINKSDEFDKILKSTFLEIVRHSVESLKEASDRRLLESDEDISVKQICERYGAVLADEVAIRLDVMKRHHLPDYSIIPAPGSFSAFKLLEFDEVNEKNEKNGKFGWCVLCRKPADYYCKTERLPVCSFQCKQLNLFQTQQLQKLYDEQTKSLTVFTSHVEQLCLIFSKYLSHSDIRRRTAFAQVFIHLSSQLRKINTRTASPTLFSHLQDVFQQCCINLVMETQAFVACVVSIKKLIPLDIFYSHLEILFAELGKKLVHFITPASIKEEILKLVRDLIKTQALFDIFMNVDCNPNRKDVVRGLISNISKLYIGIPPPEGLALLPAEDPGIRRFCYEILVLVEKSVKSIHPHKTMNDFQKLQKLKHAKNQLKSAIKRFNRSEKPTKIIKKLISQQYLPNNPAKIAEFLHLHLKKLSFVNIGLLIGDHDPLGISIRDQYIQQMQFKGHLVDEGMRILLAHFTIPGESQIVDRIIDSFSKEYFKQNEDLQVFKHSDGVFSFSYLLMMLQTNLHNPQVIEKMTLQQFRNLSKNMNGPGSEFPQQFLQKIYSSIQKKQLGFHSKRHQIQTINAYQKNQIKKAQEIHFKYLEGHLAKEYSEMETNKEKDKQTAKIDKLVPKLLVAELFGPIINAACFRIRENQEREELVKCLELIEHVQKISVSHGIEEFIAHCIKNIWEEITKSSTLKKYFLTERLYLWSREHTAYIYEQWPTIIRSFSIFHRSKQIKKQSNTKNIMVIIQDKCFLYDSYIENILGKSNKFNFQNLSQLFDALILCSKEEILDNQATFCLEKIGDVVEVNSSRMAEVLPMIWGRLKQYYIELGKHKIEKVALFGTDFLKQLVTKFIKKKDLQSFQKEYLRPFQDIFNSSVPLGVKEYIVGGLSYFVNNYFPNIKDGWKIILAILCDSFEEEQDQIVKQKSHTIVKKIYQTNFSIIDLDDNYVDYVQILGRMAREKDESYIKSCLQAIKTIMIFYENKLGINVDTPTAPENEKLDMIFWQTMWLPLLSTIYGICGDFRAEVQNQSIELLFYTLMRYGKLFKYEFWKMIMQGILRPTFEEITFTSQSKPLRKKELEDWLRNSFSRLFTSINKLILEYFDDFKLFLPDILKIYESCIVSNSNRILTQLSTEALTELLDSVGDQFQPLNWKEYLEFQKIVLKKSWPTQIQSLENWCRSKEDAEQETYQMKILTLGLMLVNCQYTVDKFSAKLQEQNLLEIRENVTEMYRICHRFNKNIQLRDSLWKNGFFEELKSLPGLIKQEHQALKGITLTKFKLIDKSEMYIDEYALHFINILDSYKKSLIVSPPKEYSAELEQKQRESTMLQVQILSQLLPNIEKIGLPKLIELGYRQTLFKYILDACTKKTFCSKCKFCEYCEGSSEREHKFTEVMRAWLIVLFEYQGEEKQIANGQVTDKDRQKLEQANEEEGRTKGELVNVGE